MHYHDIIFINQNTQTKIILTGLTGCSVCRFCMEQKPASVFFEKATLINERMNLNVIFKFILFILKYPVNPVLVFLEKRLSVIAPLILLKN